MARIVSLGKVAVALFVLIPTVILVATFMLDRAAREGRVVQCDVRTGEFCLKSLSTSEIIGLRRTHRSTLELTTDTIEVELTGGRHGFISVSSDESIGLSQPDMKEASPETTTLKISHRRPGDRHDIEYVTANSLPQDVELFICAPGSYEYQCAPEELVCYYDDRDSSICRAVPTLGYFLRSMISDQGAVKLNPAS